MGFWISIGVLCNVIKGVSLAPPNFHIAVIGYTKDISLVLDMYQYRCVLSATYLSPALPRPPKTFKLISYHDQYNL